MEGVAPRAAVDFEDVLALNVRTEIAYVMFNGVCTASAWKADGESFLTQSWDVSDISHAPWSNVKSRPMLSVGDCSISEPHLPAYCSIRQISPGCRSLIRNLCLSITSDT